MICGFLIPLARSFIMGFSGFWVVVVLPPFLDFVYVRSRDIGPVADSDRGDAASLYPPVEGSVSYLEFLQCLFDVEKPLYL